MSAGTMAERTTSRRASLARYCNTAEYDSDVHTLAVNMDYQATEKLSLNAGVTYNNAEDSWDWDDFTERATVLREDNLTPINESAAPPGQYAPVNYDTWEQNNNIDSYSDLSYEQIQVTVGGTYNFTPSCYYHSISHL